MSAAFLSETYLALLLLLSPILSLTMTLCAVAFDQTEDERLAKVVQRIIDYIEQGNPGDAELAIGAMHQIDRDNRQLNILLANARALQAVDRISREKNGIVRPGDNDSQSRIVIYNISQSPIWNPEHTRVNERWLRLLVKKEMNAEEAEGIRTVLMDDIVIVRAKKTLHKKIAKNLVNRKKNTAPVVNR